MAGGSRRQRLRVQLARTSNTGTSAAPRRRTSPRRSPIRSISSAAARDAARHRPAHVQHRASSARAPIPRRSTRPRATSASARASASDDDRSGADPCLTMPSSRGPPDRAAAAGDDPGLLRDRRTWPTRSARPRADRRMQKAHVKVQMGGAPAAVEAYRQAPTPNVIVLEFQRRPRRRSSTRSTSSPSVCDAGTKVVVDRPRQRRPALSRADAARRQRIPDRARSTCSISSRRRPTCSATPGAEPLGRTIAVDGRQGRRRRLDDRPQHRLGDRPQPRRPRRVIVDLDIAFGTAGLDFNQDPPQGIAEAIFAPDRLDANLVDRLLSKCSRPSEPARRAGRCSTARPTSPRRRSTG